jgi:tetratricopeptide (TPR) repeat protein
MLNAEDIVLLEKKWFIYKLKSKLKFILTFSILILIIFGCLLFYTYPSHVSKPQEQAQPSIQKPKRTKDKEHKAITLTKHNEKNITVASNTIKPTLEKNSTLLKVKENIQKNSSFKEKVEESKIPYFFHLTPTVKNNDLFSSNGVLIFNKPFTHLKEGKATVFASKTKNEQKNRENAISISTTKIDTITYLKDKYSSTGNIVFAIMLCEELYNLHRYDESIRWALSANEIDPTNEKSWYWFAKNKIALGQKKDAIKALETFLKNHPSRRLKNLLKEITQTKG